MTPRVLQATTLLAPAIFMAIVSARLKQKVNVRRHQQTLVETRKKMLFK